MKQNIRRLSAFLLIVATLAWIASIRRPADLSQPLNALGEARTAAPSDQSLKVGVFNIHGCKGKDRIRDVSRVAECLEGFDIVSLHEVRGGYTTNQVDELGRQLSMMSLFAPTERRWGRNDFGNGLLTNIKLRSALQIPLVMTEHTYRNALLTKFRFGDQTVQLLTVHIDLHQDREQQMRVVADLFCSLKTPAILMGDLNVEADHPCVQELLAEPGVHNALCTAPENKRDWIITKGLTAVSAGVQPNNASDHPLVYAVLILDEPLAISQTNDPQVKH